MGQPMEISSWEEGPVNRWAEHLELRYGACTPAEPLEWAEMLPIAVVAPPVDGVSNVEFLVDASDPMHAAALVAVGRELSTYLSASSGEWAYVVNQSATLGNALSDARWGYHESRLEEGIAGFQSALSDNPGFERLSFSVGELSTDSNWPWAKAHGVYCFIVDEEVVYVGRALGKTLGERLWDQLRSTSDPEWKQVVTREDNRIEVFSVPREWAFLGAALESYLIDRLHPRFNSRLG